MSLTLAFGLDHCVLDSNTVHQSFNCSSCMYVFQVLDKMVITGSSDNTACAFLLNSYKPPVYFNAHKKTIICMKTVDGMCAY